MDYLRLRHLCLAVPDLERVKRDVPEIFGVRLAFEDPHAIDFGVVNAIFPFGQCFVEMMMPASSDAPSARFLERTGGVGGYMLAFHCSEPRRRSEHAQAMGVRKIVDVEYPSFWAVQLHPRDCRGAMIEFDETEGGDDLNGPVYAAGGLVWRDFVKTDVTRNVLEVVLESPRPHDLATHWATLLERPFGPSEDGGSVDVDMCSLRFAKGDGEREMFAAVKLEVADPAAMLERARARGWEVTADAIRMGGVRFLLSTDAAPIEPTLEGVMTAMREGKEFQVGGGRSFETFLMRDGQLFVVRSDDGMTEDIAIDEEWLRGAIAREKSLFRQYLEQWRK